MDLDVPRAELMAAGLHAADLAADPFDQFLAWFDEARAVGMHEPEAMIVSSVGPGGAPSSRYVLLRGWEDGGFTFFTNYDSQKGLELAANPQVAVCFPWHILSRQVRAVGLAEPTSAEASDDYFASRPRPSQIGAWASEQSAVIAGRAELERRVDDLEQQFGDGPVPRPSNWGGFRIVPDEFEFWQGRPSRLHDRFRYRLGAIDASWTIERLSP